MPHHTPGPRPGIRRAGVAILVSALLLGAAGLPALAVPTATPPGPVPPPPPATDPAAEPVPVDEPAGLVPPLTPGLEQIDVSSPEFDRAEDHLADATDALNHVREILANAARDRMTLTARERALTRKIVAGQRRVALLDRRATRLRGELRRLAVASYMSGQEHSGYEALLELDATRHNEIRSQAVMVDTVNADLVEHLQQTTKALGVARTEVTLTTATRTGIRARLREVKEVQARAGTAQVDASKKVFGATAEVETWRRLAMVDDTDIPLVVLDSYLKAAQIAALLQPDCGIPWWALAGIGKTESHHGSAGGAEVRADGTLTKPILGIPLDGSGDTAAIQREDGAVDRAQGPMQFITSTWKRWGQDGNGDGFGDIQNTYDAAAAAAGYLCAGGPIRSDDDLRRAYFSYNHSGAYVEAVLQRAHEYEADIEIPEPDAD